MLKQAFEKVFKIRDSASRRRRLKPGADEGYDAHEKPFLDHLEDLRQMLIRIGATLAISTILCFAFHTKIFDLIKVPAQMPVANISEGVMLWDRLDLITLSPPEFIILMLKLSFYSGVIITFPFTVYFLFQFLLPGLREAEKRAVIPGAMVGFFLFLVGVAFAFFLAAPIALKFFYVFENERISNIDPTREAMEKPVHTFSLVGVEGIRYAPLKEGESAPAADGGPVSETDADEGSLSPEMRAEIRGMIRDSFATIEASNLALRYDETRGLLVVVETKGGRSVYRIGDYVSFILRLVLVFGISFQMPVVVSILVKLDLLTARVMRSTRTYAWIIILVAAAILTPPDLATLVLLGGPMIILYEICIVIATIMERARERKERAEEASRRTSREQLYLKPASELTEEEKAELHRAEIEQYEKEHAHLYEDENGHPEGEGGHGASGPVARDSLHGDEHRDHNQGEGVHDESWHEDGHYWHDGHEDDPHHGETGHEPVQDWPDPETSGSDEGVVVPPGRPDSDHAEPEDLSSGDAAEEDAAPSSTGEDASPFHDDEVCAPSGAVVDVNYASLEEIQTLPGIGPALAQAILDHRPFRSFDELEAVPGLGPAKLNAMIDRLMLG